MLIDTHALIEELIGSGVKKKQAEIITKAINQSNNDLATKTDISHIKESIAYMKENMATTADVVEIKTELKWMRILMLSVLGLLIKIAFFN